MTDQNDKWYKVSLRLEGDNLPIDDIASELGLEPNYIGRKSEHINHNPRYARHPTNLWMWTYPAADDIPFEDQITGLLRLLEPKSSNLDRILSLPDSQGELFLGFRSENGQGGAFFSAELLGRLSRLGLSLSLDLYPPSGEDAGNEPNAADKTVQ